MLLCHTWIDALSCGCAVQDNEDVKALGDEVIAFAQQWPMPGFEASELKFKVMDV